MGSEEKKNGIRGFQKGRFHVLTLANPAGADGLGSCILLYHPNSWKKGFLPPLQGPSQ